MGMWPAAIFREMPGEFEAIMSAGHKACLRIDDTLAESVKRLGARFAGEHMYAGKIGS